MSVVTKAAEIIRHVTNHTTYSLTDDFLNVMNHTYVTGGRESKDADETERKRVIFRKLR